MTPDLIAIIVFVLTALLFLYHHAAYPLVLKYVAGRKRAEDDVVYFDSVPDGNLPLESDASVLPKMRVIVPAHNEAAVIEQKVRNLAQLKYPRHLLTIVVALDGCTDKTEALARRVIGELEVQDDFSLVVYPRNIGKLAVLNAQIAKAEDDEIIVLSDASAVSEPNALLLAAQHFENAGIGVVCGTYHVRRAGSDGERKYWEYQTEIKRNEAALGSPMGAHGAFYGFRRSLWSPLPENTINDDFVLPMRIVAQGYRAVYDERIVATELERTSSRQEFWRRVRIGAGNMQQIKYVLPLANPMRGWLSFVFLSGKGLRPFIPFLVIAGVIAATVLAIRGVVLFQAALVLGAAVSLISGLAISKKSWTPPKPLAWLAYLVEGHTASFVGALRYLTSSKPTAWSAPPVPENAFSYDVPYVSWDVSFSKRAMDIICGLLLLTVLAILGPFIALAIKFTSPGPIIYQQLRVGRATHRKTELFPLYKFRTMRQDAEASTGAVWAQKNDPRITEIGAFLRKTRLDELPQAINVLRGEMSFVGPRPERPSFCRKLEREIPFYVERTFGLRPGITGLAQVNQGYDETLDDVKRKLWFDHAYALRLESWWCWLKTDIGIMFKTVAVMLLGRGQ